MSKKVLIVTGDAGEGYECWYAFHRFLEEGMKPVVASTKARRLQMVAHLMHPDWETYIEIPGYNIEATLSFKKAKARDFDAILIIGGRAPEYLRHDEALLQIVRDMHAAGKWVFSICHGIQVLAAAGILEGKRVTCYEHVRFEVKLAKATWDKRQAVRDGNLVTAQTWESHPDFYREVMQCLRGK